jgi:hypothetical protein
MPDTDTAPTTVLIGVPCSWSSIPTSFFDSLLNLDFTKGSQFSRRNGPTVASMRNMLADEARQGGFSHVLMLDADMIYAPDTLLRLLQSNREVICGFSVMRTSPHIPLFNRPGADGEPYSMRTCWPTETGERKSSALTGHVHEVHCAGGAGLLIQCSVFEKMGDIGTRYFKQGIEDSHGHEIGEDMYFAAECHKLGIKHHMDTSVCVPHMTNTTVMPEFDTEVDQWKTRYLTEGRDGLRRVAPQQVSGKAPGSGPVVMTPRDMVPAGKTVGGS